VLGVLVVAVPVEEPTFEVVLGGILGGAFAILLPGVVGIWVRTRAELLSALRERAERAEAERELLARDAVLTERTRIAREMHDAVGHRVSLMVLQAGAIEMAAGDRVRVATLAEQVQVAGRQALDELRQAVGVLRSADQEDAPLAPQPGLDDLERLVKECRAVGMDVELHQPAAISVDAVTSRAAYRIVQEALTNAGRHAPGSRVTVDVDDRAHELVVRVRNGGHPPVDDVPGGGFGLVGLRERVRTLGGRFRAEPRLDGGFEVEAGLPRGSEP
jgi:signal transduction histidine kinase